MCETRERSSFAAKWMQYIKRLCTLVNSYAKHFRKREKRSILWVNHHLIKKISSAASEECYIKITYNKMLVEKCYLLLVNISTFFFQNFGKKTFMDKKFRVCYETKFSLFTDKELLLCFKKIQVLKKIFIRQSETNVILNSDLKKYLLRYL